MSAGAAPEASDVLVLGGGLVGCSAAYFLRRRGRSVTLLERELVGRQASGTNFGNVRRQGRVLAQLPLAHRARAVWGRIEAEIGEPLEFAPLGHLRVCYTEAQAAKIAQYADEVRPLGLALEMLGAEALRRRYGFFGPGIVAGSLSPEDGHANPRLAGPAFARAAVRAGARIVEHAEVARVEYDGRSGRGFTAHTTDGRAYRGEQLLLACGAWSAPIAASLGEAVPLQARGPQMGVTEPLPYGIGPSIGISSPIETEGLYFRQVKRGNVVFGGGLKGPVDAKAIRAWVRPDNVLRQLRELRRFVPAFARVQLIRTWSGLEGYTGDGQPVMGASATTPGLHHAFGFNGEGFAIGPGVGDVMAELIATGRTETPIEAFSIARFAATAAEAAG